MCSVSTTDYVELMARSYFSLLEGASSPQALVDRAAALGMPALALTDRDAVYGIPAFVSAAEKRNIKPILGAILTLDDASPLTLLVQDATGWANLCTLITLSRRHSPKGEATLPVKPLANHHQGLIALTHEDDGEKLAQLTAWFGKHNLYMMVTHHLLPDDDRLNAHRAALAQTVGIGCVATNDVYYAERNTSRLADVLTCIRHRTTLDEAGDRLRPNSEYYLKSSQQMGTLLRAYTDAIINTRHIADRCNFIPVNDLQILPRYPTDDPHNHLRHLCQQSPRFNPEHMAAALQHELNIIQRSGLNNYFLVVWDIVRFANEAGILCQGRGSAANSLVAYLLGISPVDPLAHDLVFERFLSAERAVTPDIDMDFDAARREEVIQYIYRRYGQEHVAMACTFVTFRARRAVRDVAKALGISAARIDQIAGSLDVHNASDLNTSLTLRETLDNHLEARIWRDLLTLCRQMDGMPRHLGIHNGGMIVTGEPLNQRLPVEPATMPDRTVVQWDKDGLEDAGMVKIDVLGLRMLSVITDTSAMIAQETGAAPDWDRLGYDDPTVYDLICRADTVGVFQVESRAQAQVLPRLLPRCFNDLIVSISLIRPGPVQGDMVHPYLRRRSGEEPVTYPHPLLEPALAETLGVILFQEQVLKVARDLAGFTPGQGELLRRALGSKRAYDAIARFEIAFITGAKRRGVAEHVAQDVFTRLHAFGGYSFPKSHAASFAVLVYRSAWLKCYYPALFYTALLNNQPMGFWSPAVIVNDAKRHDIPVLSVHINRSQAHCHVEDGAIRLGLTYVKGFGDATAQQMESSAPYRNLHDLYRRSGLPERLIENLILAGALDNWGRRRDLLWKLGTLLGGPGMLDLQSRDDPVHLPSLAQTEARGMQASMTGVMPGEHVMSAYRDAMIRDGVLHSHDLTVTASGQRIRTAGLLVVHQSPPTAKGFHFLTLEDEHGFINVIVRPRVWVQVRRAVRTGGVLMVNGTIERQGEVVNVMAQTIYCL